MARTISTVTNAIEYINTLYESDSSAPTSGEDFDIWLSLLNVAVNIWENEEGVLWKELFVKLADAPDGDKQTDGTTSYTCPTLFKFPASGYVFVGSGTNKKAYKVIPQEEAQLYENDLSNWCYFLMDSSPTLEFNPNLVMSTGETISYNYYKYATKLTAGSDVIEMSDPMFAVYYAISELKKDEGDTSSLGIATQKLEAMKTANVMPTNYQDSSFLDGMQAGFGI